MELNKGVLSLLGILENTPRVGYYCVYDLGTMNQVAPYSYGWGDLPKWRYKEEKEET